MCSERVDVALLHEGRVLVDDGGMLPMVDPGEDDDQRFTTVLDAVGADVYLAPSLRLGEDHYLDVVGCRRVAPPERRWMAPAALADEAVRDLLVTTVAELGSPPDLRPPWFRAGWYDDVEAWVDGALGRAGRRRTGPLRPVKMWSISGVLQVPTDSREVWFKAASGVFAAEAAIHEVLAAHFPDDVPVLVAADAARAWLLMEPLTGESEATQAPGAGQALAARWPQVQLASLPLVGELLAAGGLLRDADAVVAGFRAVLADSPRLHDLSPDELAAVRGVAPEAEELVHELWACGLPDALSHGDLHLGNVAYDGTDLRVFDLTDACVSHPLLDASHLAAFDDSGPADDDLVAAFVRPWREAYPDADLDRAVRLAPVVDLLFQVDTFERIARATEDASAHELGNVVAWLLRRVPEAVASVR